MSKTMEAMKRIQKHMRYGDCERTFREMANNYSNLSRSHLYWLIECLLIGMVTELGSTDVGNILKTAEKELQKGL